MKSSSSCWGGSLRGCCADSSWSRPEVVAVGHEQYVAARSAIAGDERFDALSLETPRIRGQRSRGHDPTRDDLQSGSAHLHTYLAPESSSNNTLNIMAATESETNDDHQEQIRPGRSGNAAERTSASSR